NLLVDWQQGKTMKQIGQRQFYEAELRKEPYISGFLTQANLARAPEGFDASLYTARALTRPGEFTPGIEGPACGRDGSIYAVNFTEQGTIGRISPREKEKFF
ncbi:MAG: hypothetical protein MK554_07120, partial [Planctomycetes bacterium]|nr:hypothetical protein [Planctomycetota bacterium]